jgi:hypothetical protein
VNSNSRLTVVVLAFVIKLHICVNPLRLEALLFRFLIKYTIPDCGRNDFTCPFHAFFNYLL